MMVREFYDSYAATIMELTPKEKRYLSQPYLTCTMVKRVPVDLSETIIWCFLFGLDYLTPSTIAEYDHRSGQTRDKVKGRTDEMGRRPNYRAGTGP